MTIIFLLAFVAGFVSGYAYLTFDGHAAVKSYAVKLYDKIKLFFSRQP